MFSIFLITAALVRADAPPAKPFLHPLFTDNMVLQRGVADPVWGWAEPGQKIKVSLNGKTATAVAGADGKWMARIGPFKAGGPFTLTIAGSQSVTLKNVMVGDVWICSGQSNMEMGMGVINAPDDIAKANHPNLRLFTVPQTVATAPRELTVGNWGVCTPETLTKGGWGGFSAVGYFFGQNLQEMQNVPIGLIHTSWGGTVAEAWTSAEAIKASLPEFVPTVEQVEAAARNQVASSFADQMAGWWKKNDPGTAAHWQATDLDTTAWKTMNLPIVWEKAGLDSFDGVVWFRKEVTLPDGWAGKNAVLHLGPIDDIDTAFFNGVPVGATEGVQLPRDYKIPGHLVKAGRNVIAVGVLDTGGIGGIYGDAQSMKLETPGAEPIGLAGGWFYNVSVALAQTAPPPAQLDGNPNVTTVLYNGMIAPLLPFAIKGAIWYQGEANASRGKQYQTLLPTMIKDWRSRFGVGEFPFLIVQLANFMERKAQPAESAWAELREAQALTAQTLPKTGLAVAIDIGDAADIHPKNKQEVGRRLALSAQAIAYGNKNEYSGPVCDSMKIKGGKLRLKFTHASGMAVKDGGKLQGFAIAGDDKKWVWADATIAGQSVILSSPQVPNPAAARYDWADNPDGNLVNAASLPAVPFRTDRPVVSRSGTKTK